MINYFIEMTIKRGAFFVSRIHEGANKFIVNALREEKIKGIAPSHGAILMALYKEKKLTMKEIARKISRRKPTVTILIEKLKRYGYITKETDIRDSRITRVKITQKGEKIKAGFYRISNKLNKKIYQGLSEAESKTLDMLLERISKNW
jgi:MarR family transcriptional regulator, organic hydroperoxide resistance regulator